MARGGWLLITCACLALPRQASADTLKEALAQAYETNPTLEAARAQLRATDENVPIQRADGLPSLNASGQYTEYVVQATSSFINPERAAQAGLELSVPLYSGGRVRNGINAAETRVLAGRANLRATESSVFSQVVAAYMDVILQEAIVGLSSNNVDVLQVNLQATSDRFEIGDLTRTDVAQSQARLAQAESSLRSAKANLTEARERYIRLVGEMPTDLQAPPPLPGLPETPDDAVIVALENNPDMIAARREAKAAGYDIEVAGAGRLPTVSLFANGNYNNYLGTLGSISGSPADQAQTSSQAGVRVQMPLFQGGAVSARQRQAQANASAALERAIGTEREIIATVRAAYSSWQAANEIIRSSQAAVDAADLSLEGVRAENTVGNRTILDILNAQQELLSAQVDLVTARRNAYVAGFTLLAAMGRAEARDLGLEDEIVGPLYDPTEYYDRVRGNLWDWSRNPDPVAESTRTVDIPAPDGEISE
ncbi:TolC family outer membrane protein [Croceibacterium atlanticum]|uniref:TolC family outer membrane protein n=1 Tax=Croceibacterium atlanticum TaxID=1267766 RepID=UPI00062C5BC7|nr:TolC family outer membrane protein [Croceibacterium atlanticum]